MVRAQYVASLADHIVMQLSKSGGKAMALDDMDIAISENRFVEYVNDRTEGGIAHLGLPGENSHLNRLVRDRYEPYGEKVTGSSPDARHRAISLLLNMLMSHTPEIAYDPTGTHLPSRMA